MTQNELIDLGSRTIVCDIEQFKYWHFHDVTLLGVIHE